MSRCPHQQHRGYRHDRQRHILSSLAGTIALALALGTATTIPALAGELIRELIDAPEPVCASHWLAGISRDLPEDLETVVAALEEAGADY